MSKKATIREVIHSGTPHEKRVLFGFASTTSDEKVLAKFKLFSRANYPRFFPHRSAPFHDEMILNYIRAYRGQPTIEIAFRGASKTSILKLFITFVILNDQDRIRKYLKVLSRDLKNSKQIVTDIYNLIVEVQPVYGDFFEKEGDIKREETMGSFTTKDGRKLTSGTVGQSQRGHVQDAFRPDFLIFEDIEDRESISSIVITESIITRCDEAIQGKAFDASYVVNANYISDAGVVQWFLNKSDIHSHIIPIVIGDVPTWSRYTPELIAKLKADAEDWAGDYLCDPTRSGDKFFDIERVRADLAEAVPPTRKAGLIRYWGSYNPSHRYGIGGDLSDGIGKDSCAAAAFDFKNGELVATGDDNETAPDLFAYELVRLGQEFGNAILAPETNNTCGGIAIRVLKEEEYPNIYQKELTDRVNNVVSTVLGWHTNSKTKPDMFYEFRKDYDDGLIIIRDERVLKEMLAFTKLDLKDAHSSAITRHFDLLTAVVIAWQMKDHASNGESVREFYKNLGGGHTGAVR